VLTSGPSSTPSPSTIATSSATGAVACPRPSPEGGYPHQAPEIEKVLPASVAGRDLTRWSVRGRCWLELAITSPADIAPFVARFRTPTNPSPANDTDLVYGVAGRSNLSTDPPFFVYGAVRPTDEAELTLVLALLFGGGRFLDIADASDLSRYQEQTIAGKQVYVGTLGMLSQDIHQRGRPFLYQNDQYLFLVITDDDAWAAAAIGQLP